MNVSYVLAACQARLHCICGYPYTDGILARSKGGVMTGISVFFPAYNDGGTIASMVLTAAQTLQTVTDDYEIIVVQNGSTDNTVEVLDALDGQVSHLRVLKHEEPLGYGGALRKGFASATKELIFYTDSDAQYDVRELPL